MKLTNETRGSLNPTVTRAELLRIGYNMPNGDQRGTRNFMAEIANKRTGPQGDPARIINDFQEAWHVSGNLLGAVK